MQINYKLVKGRLNQKSILVKFCVFNGKDHPFHFADEFCTSLMMIKIR